MLPTATLIQVSAGRWSVPLLALTKTRDGVRFAEAVRTLGMARGVARQTFDSLIGAGWIARNPGHGHPLRPEYVLTATGRSVAARCERLLAARQAAGLASDDLTRWTIPVVVQLAAGEARFSELMAALAPVSPRALSLTLKQGMAMGLIARTIEDGFPPTTRYALTERGAALAAGSGAVE